MSVISLLKDEDVRRELSKLLPPTTRRIAAPLLAPPLTRAYGLVGTAFDYAARFELQRRCPHARTESWVAKGALARLPRYTSEPKVIRQATQLVEQAEAEVESYIEAEAPTPKQRTAMAASAIRLAKIDATYRIGFVDPTMAVAEPDNVKDILGLLEVAPFDVLSHPTILWLNPTFGAHSRLVGGADCDLVSGSRLIDIKVTKNDAMEPDYLLQLISYAILSRGARDQSPDWPAVDELGIYFARHGHLWLTPASSIYEHPEYGNVESWYFQRASQEFGTRKPQSLESRRAALAKGLPPGINPEDVGLDDTWLDEGLDSGDKPSKGTRPSRRAGK